MEEDLTEVYLQWLNDEEICAFNSHAIFPNSMGKMKEYFNKVQSSNNDVILAIIHSDTGKHIGNVTLQNINWVYRNAEFAILLGDKDFWGNGYGEEAAILIVQYGFYRLNLHRIYCGTISGNSGMIKLADKLKMKEEGVRRMAVFKNGQYRDVIMYGVLKSEFL
jgi:RimJ/RimL family protein N-acetyltransferase